MSEHLIIVMFLPAFIINNFAYNYNMCISYKIGHINTLDRVFCA